MTIARYNILEAHAINITDIICPLPSQHKYMAMSHIKWVIFCHLFGNDYNCMMQQNVTNTTTTTRPNTQIKHNKKYNN